MLPQNLVLQDIRLMLSFKTQWSHPTFLSYSISVNTILHKSQQCKYSCVLYVCIFFILHGLYNTCVCVYIKTHYYFANYHKIYERTWGMLPFSIIPSGSPLALYFYSVLILPSFPFQTLVQVALHVGALTPCGIPEKNKPKLQIYQALRCW